MGGCAAKRQNVRENAKKVEGTHRHTDEAQDEGIGAFSDQESADPQGGA